MTVIIVVLVRASLLVLALVAACHAGHPEIACRVAEERPGEGVNPLLPPGRQRCFESVVSCEAGATSGACTALARPRWHCFTVSSEGPTSDPMNGTTSCWPSLAICDASRPPASNPCQATVAVSCTVGDHAFSCHATQADCERSRDFVSQVLHRASAPCAPPGRG